MLREQDFGITISAAHRAAVLAKGGVGMLVDHDEFLQLLGLQKPVNPGEGLHFILDGTGRRASIVVDADGGFLADVTEEVDGDDGTVIVTLSGRIDSSGVEIDGYDASGESSEPADPRAAASAFRRLVRPMRLLETA